MSVIYNILLITFFSALFALTIFAVERIKSTSWWIKLNFIPSTMFLIEGVIYGILIFGLNLLFENIYSNNIAYWLIGFFILFSVRDVTVASISLIPATLYYLIHNQINNVVYSMYSIIFALAISFIFAKFFSNNFLSRVITYPIFILVALVLWLSLTLSDSSISLPETINPIVLTTIGAIFGELIVYWFIKASISANVLYESINFAFSKYYRSQLKDQAIGNLIKEQKIDKALYVTFDIKVDTLDIDAQREAVETILKNLEFGLPKESILFQGDNSKYGAFIPLFEKNIDLRKLINDNYHHTPKNNIDFLRTIINKQSVPYILKNGSIVNANVSAGIAIYGVQSNSLRTLEKDSSFALNYINPNSMNSIAIFDSNEYRERKHDNRKLGELEEVLELASLDLKFKPIYGEENINMVEFISNNEEEFFGSISNYAHTNGSLETYNRYLSAVAIKDSKNFNGSLALPYNFSIFKDIQIKKFIRRLELLDFQLNKLVFMIYSFDITRDKKVRETFNKLKEEGARFAFVDLVEKQQSIINYYKPDFIFVKNLDNIFVGENVVYIDVASETELIKAMQFGIEKFSGVLISSKSKPHILSKQSKIYIEEIKERGKNE